MQSKSISLQESYWLAFKPECTRCEIHGHSTIKPWHSSSLHQNYILVLIHCV